MTRRPLKARPRRGLDRDALSKQVAERYDNTFRALAESERRDREKSS